MTLKRMAQSALDVQSAVNLSGVIATFAEIVSSMRMDHAMDTHTCNRHPVCRLFAEQIAFLTSGGSVENESTGMDYSRAYDSCWELSKS